LNRHLKSRAVTRTVQRHKYLKRWVLALFLVLAVTGLFMAGFERLQLNADILSSLPQKDPVLADAGYVLANHPIYDRVAVDVSLADGPPALLEEGAAFVESAMRASGLFREVGFQSAGRLMPSLIRHVTDSLPVLFSREDLEENVKPLLGPDKIRETLEAHAASLQDLGGIGQAAWIADDPLNLRYLVLSRMASLAPSKGGRIENGRLVSGDGKHILVVAEPASSGMDTRYARKIASLMDDIAAGLKEKYGSRGSFVLNPVGAYRAALDNEVSAKNDVHKAILFSTIAIIVLLIVAFPRPLLGMLALVPAFAGTMTAVFVYSLMHRSISLMAVGFGGAIISFTVDYGLAYLLFLDRPYETRGGEASRELWSLGLLAMLTTAVSFAFLSVSGFAILMEIGQFAALGVVFTYIFVHAVFPLVFPIMPPAKREPRLPLQRFIDAIASDSGKWKVYAAVAFGLVMLVFAKPDFKVDLGSMNSLSRETMKADQTVRGVWGDLLSKVYIMVEGRNAADFQRRCDDTSAMLDREKAAGRVAQYFSASTVFPGNAMAGGNAAAWREFWTPARIAGLKRNLGESGRALGFSEKAFEPFLKSLAGSNAGAVPIPEEYAPLLGLRQAKGGWTQVISIAPGPSYRGAEFFQSVTGSGLARVFDPSLFSRRLGSLLHSTFLYMALIVGLITLLTAYFYFLDWKLTAIGVAPTVFAVVCTLGTLNLMGQPLGIPILIVSVVVIGMGTDYALYLVRAQQRYQDEASPSLGLIRLSVFLSFATTFLGFGVLALAENSMLKSAGLGLALGIGYSFIGAVMIAPPLVRQVFAPREEAAHPPPAAGSREHFRRAMARFSHMESYPRVFARFKIMMDPMFPKLASYLDNPRVIIDIGTGYGVPAAWLLELFPEVRIYGIEPDRRRVRVAGRVVGRRGAITVGAAPDLPDVPEKADTAMILDVIHMLSDEDLRRTLAGLREKLDANGRLVLRATLSGVPGTAERRDIVFKRMIEVTRIRIFKGICNFRTEQQVRDILDESGFEAAAVEQSAPGHEEFWFVARPKDVSPNGTQE
jgi:predicted exporter